jgi:hypothetical protein
VAVRFDISNERITIRQSRTVLRAMLPVLAVIAVLGLVLLPFESRLDPPGTTGPDLRFVVPAVLLGWALIFLALRPFSVTIRAVLDRAAGRIEVHGGGWLMRRWSVDRPLRDVFAIDLRSGTVIYFGNAARTVSVYAVFADGTEALLWSPAFASQRTIAERVGALRTLTGR